ILITRLYHKKSILNYRSGEAEDHISRWRRTAAPIMRLADLIAVPSGYLVEVFGRSGLCARAVSNVVDTELFGYREREPLSPVFLSNRNLEPLYNVECTLIAFGKIQQRYPEARLVVAGDGTQRKALERRARELALSNTEFVGQVTPEAMIDLYRKADIYLNSSNIDNMPGSILESFSSGLPVVTSNAGGIPYIVRHEETGLMVERDDPEGLAASAIRLLEDASLARKVIRNARAECARYEWNAVREEWIRLYRELAARRQLRFGARPAGGLESGFAPRFSKMRAGTAAEDGASQVLGVLLVAPSMDILGGQSIQAEYLRSHLQGAAGLAVTLLPINPVLPGPLRLLQRIKYVRTLVTTAAYIASLVKRLP